MGLWVEVEDNASITIVGDTILHVLEPFMLIANTNCNICWCGFEHDKLQADVFQVYNDIQQLAIVHSVTA